MAINLPLSQRRLGLKIRQYREAKDLNQDDFAHRANLSTSYLSQIENGKRNLSFGAMLQIAAVLDISLPDLVKDVDLRSPIRDSGIASGQKTRNT